MPRDDPSLDGLLLALREAGVDVHLRERPTGWEASGDGKIAWGPTAYRAVVTLAVALGWDLE